MNMRIGELAQKSGCKAVTIRYYEQIGLLPEPMRSSNRYRLYDERHVERLQFIRHCRALDMSQDEIKTILDLQTAPQHGCAAVNRLIDRHIDTVQQRIAALIGLKQHLQQLRGKCSGTDTIATCGIVQSLADGSCHHAAAQSRQS